MNLNATLFAQIVVSDPVVVHDEIRGPRSRRPSTSAQTRSPTVWLRPTRPSWNWQRQQERPEQLTKSRDEIAQRLADAEKRACHPSKTPKARRRRRCQDRCRCQGRSRAAGWFKPVKPCVSRSPVWPSRALSRFSVVSQRCGPCRPAEPPEIGAVIMAELATIARPLRRSPVEGRA